MKINKFIIVMGILIISGINGGIFADDIDMSCVTMIDKLELNQETTDVRKLTQEFCGIIFDSKCTHDGDVFDANQSIFLSLLCDNVGKGEKFVSINRLSKDEGGVLLKTGFDQFGIYDYGFLDDSDGTDINFCDHNVNNMNGCNYAEHLPKMFDEIMNDFFNIKHADLYGVDRIDDNVTSEMAANKFANNKIAGLGKVGSYENSICNPDSEYYGDTCKYLKNYMKNVKNLLKKTKVIDVENLINNKIGGIDEACTINFVDNILYCSLLGDDITAEKSFLNVVYNEYLWYRLFVSYYSYELSVESKFSELVTGDRIEKMKRNREKIYSFQEQMLRSRQAVSVALRSLSEISSSFPLHVGFLMYQEDAKIFMKKLSKLYPPIMTLFDKLRNVQKAE